MWDFDFAKTTLYIGRFTSHWQRLCHHLCSPIDITAGVRRRKCHCMIQKYRILDTYYSNITNCFHLKQLSHSDISLCSSYVSSYLHMPSTIVFIMFGTERIVGVTQGKVMRSTCSEVFVRNTKRLLNMFTMSSTRVQKCAGKCSVPSFCRLLQQLQLLEEVKPPVQILLAIYGQSKR